MSIQGPGWSKTEVLALHDHFRFTLDSVEKVFLTDERIFLEPLVRCSCGDVRGTTSFHTKTTTDRRIGPTERCSGGDH
jgi:hypothetical protein